MYLTIFFLDNLLKSLSSLYNESAQIYSYSFAAICDFIIISVDKGLFYFWLLQTVC